MSNTKSNLSVPKEECLKYEQNKKRNGKRYTRKGISSQSGEEEFSFHEGSTPKIKKVQGPPIYGPQFNEFPEEDLPDYSYSNPNVSPFQRDNTLNAFGFDEPNENIQNQFQMPNQGNPQCSSFMASLRSKAKKKNFIEKFGSNENKENFGGNVTNPEDITEYPFQIKRNQCSFFNQ
ncbi:MAG: hypothetical protein MJ252_10865 [archaeon]|nr:hypothetical protein [archaeon]